MSAQVRRDPSQEGPDYRCKACGEIVPRGTHHKMTTCKCKKVMVDRGWYGSRVLWDGGKFEDAVEVIPAIPPEV